MDSGEPFAEVQNSNQAAFSALGFGFDDDPLPARSRSSQAGNAVAAPTSPSRRSAPHEGPGSARPALSLPRAHRPFDPTDFQSQSSPSSTLGRMAHLPSHSTAGSRVLRSAASMFESVQTRVMQVLPTSPVKSPVTCPVACFVGLLMVIPSRTSMSCAGMLLRVLLCNTALRVALIPLASIGLIS